MRSVRGAALALAALGCVALLGWVGMWGSEERGVLLSKPSHVGARGLMVNVLTGFLKRSHNEIKFGKKARNFSRDYQGETGNSWKELLAVKAKDHPRWAAAQARSKLMAQEAKHPKHPKAARKVDDLHTRTFRSTKGLMDGMIPGDMFTKMKSSNGQMLAEVRSHRLGKSGANMAVVDSGNGIPELHLEDAKAFEEKESARFTSKAASSEVQASQAARSAARSASQDAERSAAGRGGRSTVEVHVRPVREEIGEDENAEAMQNLRDAMMDQTQAAPGHRDMSAVRRQGRMSQAEAQRAYDQQQRPTESYYAYKWRLAHES